MTRLLLATAVALCCAMGGVVLATTYTQLVTTHD